MTDTVRKILLVLLIAVFAATCLAFTITSLGSKDGADYINPANAGNAGGYNGKYSISVTSAGGLNLSGVRITAKKNGQTIMTGISQNGKIEMNIPANEYELIVDESSLPAGYYIPEGTKFSTTAQEGSAKVIIPSRVISTTAASNKRYNLGDVMHDFSYVEASSGTRYTLSEVLSSKKAVMLNFWYADCNPCRSEFPAIQKAYEEYGNKIAIIALSNSDSDRAISQFKEEQGLTFHMAPDKAGMTSKFDVEGFPTTVIIDRYGVVAYKYTSAETSESIWKSLFNKYTSDKYIQQETNPSDSDDDDGPNSYVKPDSNLRMPASNSIEDGILNNNAKEKINNFCEETGEKDAPYSWPWLLGEAGGEKYLFASNASTDFSFATVYCDVTLNSGDVLSYYYNIKSESGRDVLYTLINGKLVAEHSGNSGGWKQQYGVYVADRTVTVKLAFLFIKDKKFSEENEFAGIKNISITDVRDSAANAIDQKVTATDGLTLSAQNKYNINLIAPNTAGNNTKYYKLQYVDESGHTQQSLLYADVLNTTVWSEKHIGVETFTPPDDESLRYPPAVYHLSYWYMSNHNDAGESDDESGEKIPLLFNYGCSAALTSHYSDMLIENYYLQDFSDNGLVPVTEDLKQLLIAFTKEYCRKNNVSYYEDQWLELCLYFKHFGAMHSNGKNHINGNPCSAVVNPVEGMSYTHAYTINEAGDIIRDVNLTSILDYNGGGLWYKFTPKATGVYRFYSTRTATQQYSDPCIAIYPAELPYPFDLGNAIGFSEHDDGYNKVYSDDWNDFNLFVVLQEGVEYRIQATAMKLGIGPYRMHITYVGESYDYLRVASYDGSWSDFGKYNAIDIAYNKTGTGFYHAINKDGSYGSPVYIDFIHNNYFDQNENSLYKMVIGGKFRFRGGNDYTQELLNYYYKACANKSVADPLYGLIEADARLVEILNELIYRTHGDGSRAYAWLMFACFYEHYQV